MLFTVLECGLGMFSRSAIEAGSRETRGFAARDALGRRNVGLAQKVVLAFVFLIL